MQIHTIWKELSLTALQAPPVFQLEKFNQKHTTAATTRGLLGKWLNTHWCLVADSSLKPRETPQIPTNTRAQNH